MAENEKNNSKFSTKNVNAISLGLNVAVGMGCFVSLGIYIDRRMGDGILFTLFGIVLGLLYCFYEIGKVIMQMKERSNDPNNGAQN